jgi:hypothetical protein
MALDLNIIVTCTKLKTRPIPSRLRLRAVPGRDVDVRAARWVERVQDSGVEAVPAVSLYAGDHWRIAKGLPEIAAPAGFRATLWIISTGFGLIRADSKISPYSATFSHSHPDSVSKSRFTKDGTLAFQRWWDLISQWEGPDPGTPRTLAALAAAKSNAAFLVVASAAYLSAVSEDLKRAFATLRHPGRFAILSAGTKDLGDLSGALIPLDARMQARLGGARRTLNVRMARRVLTDLKSHPFDAAEMNSRYRRLLARQPEVIVRRRTKRTDEQVRAFIHRHLSQHPSFTQTRLLGQLRAIGWGCEQSRFNRLFEATSEGVNGRSK